MSHSVSHFEVPGLVGTDISALLIEDGDQVFAFRGDGRIVSGGLWRLLVKGTIAATEADLTQSDWRPNSKSIEEQVNGQLNSHVFDKTILRAYVTVPTGDLVIHLPDDVTLEFIKRHSFLEAWEVRAPGLHLLVDAWGRVQQWKKV